MKFLFVICCTFIIFYSAGAIQRHAANPVYHSSEYGQASFSSLSPKEKYANAYDHIQCPDQKRIQQLFEKIKLKAEKMPTDCSDPFYGKLAKLLVLTEKIELTLPEHWKNSILLEIAEPFEYVSSKNDSIEYDPKMDDALAVNRSSGKISLGPRFFHRPPLDSLGVLIHETRHSDDRDAGHRACAYGDIPTIAGGCDYSFSNSAEKAGAYSYGVYSNFATAKLYKDISKDDKQVLLNEALVDLANRFNVVPTKIALLTDNVFAVSSDGEIAKIHPFTGTTFRLPIDLSNIEGKIVRIELHNSQNHILAFTDKHKIYIISPQGKVKKFREGLLPENYQIKEVARMRILYDNFPYETFVDFDNQIRYFKYDYKQDKVKIETVEIGKDKQKIPIKRILLGFGDEAFYLSEEGKIYVAQRWGSDPEFFNYHHNLHIPGVRWTAATGGIVYDDLYLIAEDGRFFKAGFNEIPGPDDLDFPTKDYFVKPIKLPNDLLIKKYLQAMRNNFLLSSDGQLYAADKKLESLQDLDGENIVDFTILRSAQFVESFQKSDSQHKSLSEICNVSIPMNEPWTQSAFGINHKKELVFLGPNLECLHSKIIGKQKIKTAKIIKEPVNADAGFFSSVFIEVELVGNKTVKLMPYHFSDKF